jgi:3-methyl-2-oxobutanoate hydroxymethyltransferase
MFHSRVFLQRKRFLSMVNLQEKGCLSMVNLQRKRFLSTVAKTKPITIRKIKKKAKPAMITAYDAPSARLVDASGADIILVGDSVGMVVAGEPDTTRVTMEQMIHHCAAVSRSTKRAFVVGDMPNGSYEISSEQAMKNAFRFIKEGGVNAVKLEGMPEMAEAIVKAGIPVMGHVGLLPQSVNAHGGFLMQGKSSASIRHIWEQAHALADAGCFAIVLECVTPVLAAQITNELAIPTIGIGSGSSTDGQVLVYHDMLGYHGDVDANEDSKTPSFAKQYVDLSSVALGGLEEFVKDVKYK